MKKRRATTRFFTVLLAVLAAGAISFNAASSSQTIAKKWVKRYDATGYRDDPNDFAYAMAVDSSGNIYVTGLSAGSSTGQDFATIKYSSAGKQLWVKRYNGPGNGADVAWAIVVDSSGNIYVTGSSEGSGTDHDYATIKYSSAGKQLWVKRYNGPGNGWDVARAIATDRSGNIYVTGESAGSKTGKDFATIKYSSAGKELWVKRYNGQGNKDDCASGIAVDGSGNVYVTGDSAGSSTGQDAAIIKYSSAGIQLWMKRHNGPGNKDDGANAMAVDGSGNVYVAGSSAGSGSGYDYAVIKYSGAGKELWLKRYNGPKNGNDHPLAIAVDGSGNIYVTGYSWAGEIWESGTGNDYATIKYSSAGKQLWVKRYDGPGNREDYARAIAVDGSGNIYVTGSSTGSDFESDISDYVTIKYSGAGVQLWLDRYDGPGGWGENDDGANAIAVDKSGNVYVTGYSTGSDTGYDYATIKY
jgi:uncharacterized delta-60 repeat protein